MSAKRGAIAFGHLPEQVAEHIGSRLGIVYISYDSLLHIMEKHKILMLEMLCLPDMMSNGLWIGERANQACVVYSDPNSGKRFIGAVKVAAQGYEVYLKTFHICRKRQTASLLRRGRVLQNHK